MTNLTLEHAREALEDMDDYARMDAGVDAKGPREVLERFIAEHERVVAELRAENERLRTDAERYRWLREEGDAITVCEWSDGEWIPLHPKNIDATIDVAMKEQPR